VDDAGRTDLLKQAARVLADDSASDWLWLIPNLQVAAAGITGVPLNAVGDGYPVSRIARS
jgi:peptide/nickel transport system substrate-binding protein